MVMQGGKEQGGARLGRAVAAFVLLASVAIGVGAWVFTRHGGRPPAAQTTALPAGPPVLLITVDTLRADHVGCYGDANVQTPAIDFLAAQGVRFDNAFAQVPMTLPSHTVILSGTYPMWSGLRSHNFLWVDPSLGLLPEAFARHGYETAAFVSSYVLDQSWGLNRGFQNYDDRPNPQSDPKAATKFTERRAEDTINHLLAWFRAHDPHAPGARPFFVWLHLYDPHYPYEPPEPYHSMYADHLYDGEIAYTDSQLGRLFDYLREIGFYDRTLIVLMSDHGESLGDHGEQQHGYFIYRSTLHVPLIFKPPLGVARKEEMGRVIPEAVGAVDVAPTVLELIHFRDPLTQQFQGSSLAASVLGKRGASGRAMYSETYYPKDVFGFSSLHSLIKGHSQYIEAPHPELYDLAGDPREKHNFYAQRLADASALRSELLAIESRYTRASAAVAAGTAPSQEAVERLKALGYVAIAAPTPAAPDNLLPDPKDRVKMYAVVEQAGRLYEDHKVEEADRLLKALVQKEPNLPFLHYMLGSDAAAEQRWEDAEREFRASLRGGPEDVSVINELALVYKLEGKMDESRKWLQVMIARDPRIDLAYYELGELDQEQLRVNDARKEFQKAVELNPNSPNAQQALGLNYVQSGQFSEAVKPLEAAVALGVRDAETFGALGSAYLNTNHNKQAIQAYQSALALQGDYTPARLSLALAYLKSGDRHKAMDEFHTACGSGAPECEQYQRMFQ